jgi:hypothetical protein
MKTKIPAKLLIYDDDGENLVPPQKLEARICWAEEPIAVEIELPNELGVIFTSVIIKYSDWNKIAKQKQKKKLLQ